MNDKKYFKLTPFKMQVLQSFPFIDADFDALTNYELLCKVVEYLNLTMDNVNILEDDFDKLKLEFVALKDYIDNYFENLDVQEEIDNKLDEMAESGELAEIIAEFLNYQIDNTLVNYINLSEKDRLAISETDLYNSLPHTYPQGMCVISSSNIVLAYVNQNADDQNVRLVEYNLVLKSIVRTAYLQLNHANSLTYDNTNGKIYVAFCNQTSGGVTTPDNRIGIVDYANFTLDNVVTPSNIPSGDRIRSVYYDNENNTLYAGSYFKVFKLNNVYSVVETITLSTDNIDSNVEDYNLNQSFKVKDDKVYGLFMSFIGIWKNDGTLLKVIDLVSPTNLENIGEFEDFDFLSDNSVLISTTKKESALDTNRLNVLYLASFTKNVSVNLPFTRLNNDTNEYVLYVNGSYSGLELGTSSHPYKSLQRAVNIARQIKTNVNINISAGSYDSIYLNGVYNVIFTPLGAITIDGMRVWKSTLFMYNPSYDVRINGLEINDSKVTLRTRDTSGDIDIYNNTDTTTFYSCANIINNSDVCFQSVNFIGNDTRDLVNIGQSRIMLSSCTFTNYEGHYAVYGTQDSTINSYECTFNETASTSQHNYHLTTGTILFKGIGQQTKNDIVLESQSAEFPSARWLGGVEGTGYTGTLVTTLDTHYNAIIVRCRTSGTSAKNNYFLIPLLQNNAYTLNAQWLNATYVNNCMLCINKSNGGLEIEYNRLSQLTIATGVTKFYNYGDNGAPADSAFMQVLDIGYINI